MVTVIKNNKFTTNNMIKTLDQRIEILSSLRTSSALLLQSYVNNFNPLIECLYHVVGGTFIIFYVNSVLIYIVTGLPGNPTSDKTQFTRYVRMGTNCSDIKKS